MAMRATSLAPTAEVLVAVEQDFESVAGADARHVLWDRDERRDRATGVGEREELLERLVRDECDTKLRTAAQDARGATLEQRAKALLSWDLAEGVDQAAVVRLALACLGLETRLDHVGGCREIGCGHASDRRGSKRLTVAQLFPVLALVEDVLLEVGVGWEV